MKKLMSSLVVLLMVALFSSNFTSLAASLPLRVVVNGEKVFFPDAQPFIDAQQRVQLPVRFISEALGAKVLWDGPAKKTTISLDDKTMVVYIGKKGYEVNGKTKQMDTAALFKESRTFVPLRFVYEGLGVTVKWEDTAKTVYITTPTSEATATAKPTTEPTDELRVATVHGFKIPYTELGPSRDPVYISKSQLTVFESPNPKPGHLLLQITIKLNKIGSDPEQEVKEAEAILRQKIESDVVDSIMKYVGTKTERTQELPLKYFKSNSYDITVTSREMGDIGIGIWPRSPLLHS